MCFYYNLSKIAQRYSERAENSKIFRIMDLVNGFEHPEMPVIANEKMELMHWGLIPYWSKNDEIKKYTLNARAETIFEKPSFKKSIISRRCIIPATGFFEWQHIGKKKQRWFIYLKNQELFSFAGIWDSWNDKNSDKIINSYSIITTVANPLLAEIHNTKKRMPVVLNRDNEFDWIDKDLSIKEITDFFTPLGEEYFEAYPVSPSD
jgi:putative SOS response-associated peptidase YedK